MPTWGPDGGRGALAAPTRSLELTQAGSAMHGDPGTRRPAKGPEGYPVALRAVRVRDGVEARGRRREAGRAQADGSAGHGMGGADEAGSGAWTGGVGGRGEADGSE